MQRHAQATAGTETDGPTSTNGVSDVTAGGAELAAEGRDESPEQVRRRTRVEKHFVRHRGHLQTAFPYLSVTYCASSVFSPSFAESLVSLNRGRCSQQNKI